MSRKIVLVVTLLLSSVPVAGIILVKADTATAQTSVSAPAVQSTAQPSPIPTPTATDQPGAISPELELLLAYEKVLESSLAAIADVQSTTKGAVETVESTTRTVLWLVGVLLAVLAGERLGSLALAHKATQDVTKSVQEASQARQEAVQAAQEATSSNQSADKAEQQAAQAMQEVVQVRDLVSKVQSIHKNLEEQAREVQEKVAMASEELGVLRMDVEWYEGLMLVAQIRSHSLRLFREDECEDAINSLREQLKHKDPVARLEIVRAFQVWAEYETGSTRELCSRVRQILETLVDPETEPLVCLEAERAIKALGRRRRRK